MKTILTEGELHDAVYNYLTDRCGLIGVSEPDFRYSRTKNEFTCEVETEKYKQPMESSGISSNVDDENE